MPLTSVVYRPSGAAGPAVCQTTSRPGASRVSKPILRLRGRMCPTVCPTGRRPRRGHRVVSRSRKAVILLMARRGVVVRVAYHPPPPLSAGPPALEDPDTAADVEPVQGFGVSPSSRTSRPWPGMRASDAAGRRRPPSLGQEKPTGSPGIDRRARKASSLLA
jgi:hypothetical protein